MATIVYQQRLFKVEEIREGVKVRVYIVAPTIDSVITRYKLCSGTLVSITSIGTANVLQ